MTRSDQSTTMLTPVPTARRYLPVAQQLLLAMARGDLPVGSRLPSDRDLAAQAQVSRPTAREAVLVLELAGAVETRPGDGVYVARPGARVGARSGPAIDAPPQELIEARGCIEPAVAALAAQRVDKTMLTNLRELVSTTKSMVDDGGQLAEFVSLSLRFHVDLAHTCGNRISADIITQLVDVEVHPLWMLVNQQAMRSPEARANQVAEHEQVLDAIAAGDPEAAMSAMAAHVHGLKNDIFGLPAGANQRLWNTNAEDADA